MEPESEIQRHLEGCQPIEVVFRVISIGKSLFIIKSKNLQQFFSFLLVAGAL